MSNAKKHVESPVWEFIAAEVVRLLHNYSTPPTILDLASGPGEPACTVALRLPAAQVICTDKDKAMLAAADLRVRKLDLGDRVRIKQLDMLDLSSITSASIDAVTICLGLHLIPKDIQRVLHEVARVLVPGGYLIATVWDKIPMVDCCCSTMERLTGEPGMSFLPEDPFQLAGGRMDPLLARADFAFIDSHSCLLPVTINAGAVDSDRLWKIGPLAILPRLVLSPPRELAAFRAKFRETCKAHDLLNSRDEVCMTQVCRLVAVHKRGQHANGKQARQQIGAQTMHQHTKLHQGAARVGASQACVASSVSSGGLLRLLVDDGNAGGSRWTFAPGTPDTSAIS